jgi:hypothetical protein
MCGNKITFKVNGRTWQVVAISPACYRAAGSVISSVAPSVTTDLLHQQCNKRPLLGAVAKMATVNELSAHELGN